MKIYQNVLSHKITVSSIVCRLQIPHVDCYLECPKLFYGISMVISKRKGLGFNYDTVGKV
jgi:hypothetical protein